MFTIWTSFPDAPFASSLIHKALQKNFPNNTITTSETQPSPTPDGQSPPMPFLQWCTYDSLSHEDTLSKPTSVLASSYTIRKSLIRKTFLHSSLSSYMSKHGDSYLVQHPGSVPQTWAIDISWADELDELWADDLYELAELLDANDELEHEGEKRWFILKPSMADRGQGIRLFESRDALREIFESFEDLEDDDEDDSVEGKPAEDEDKPGKVDTGVIASQLRHFVIQEYISRPLLLDPAEVQLPGALPKSNETLQPRKFHIRAYCVAAGALQLYVATNFLALFAGAPYTNPRRSSPSPDDDEETKSLDLAPHLTNTALQTPTPENPDPNDNVRLLSEMIGCHILSSGTSENEGARLTEGDVAEITEQVCEVLADTFRAALESSVHFQPLPNAFELFGADLLVSYDPSPVPSTSKFSVSILELNAEPAIELTGARLSWILEEMFYGICKACVEPFFRGVDAQKAGKGVEQADKWDIGETRWTLKKCLDVQVRGERGW